MYREREPQGGRGEPQGWDGGSRGGEGRYVCFVPTQRRGSLSTVFNLLVSLLIIINTSL